MSKKKKIILFYKNLVSRGGAELLILKEYKYFKKMGYQVSIITYHFNKACLFAENINYEDLFVFNSKNNFINWLKLLKFILQHKDSYFLISSGRIEFYLATLFINIKYSIHIHQPLFMSSRDKDKYSVFLKNKFVMMTKNNPLKDYFEKFEKNLNLLEKLKINLQSILTILSYRKAQNTFVLSNYSKEEKKILFNINAIVEKGAIEENVFKHKVKNVLPQFKNAKFKFLTICRLDNTKRIDVLIEACKLFYKHEKNFVLVICGDGPEIDNFKNLTKINNLENNVFFPGFILEKDKLDYLKWPDLFISIDWADYTISTIEALSLGTKCLVSEEREMDKSIIQTGLISFTKPNPQDTCKEIIISTKKEITVDIKKVKRILNGYTWRQYCQNILSHITDK